MNTPAVDALTIDRKLVEKYSGRGPRYTSYPTAPEWTEDVGPDELIEHIRSTNRPGSTAPISLYIHVPFCRERCYYCGCNTIVTRRDDILGGYVDRVIREVELVSKEIAPDRSVIQFHLGGGTPTHLPPSELGRMLENVTRQFRFENNAERSIEVDLRVTRPEHLDVLRRSGFNRISTGVQEFSEATQQAINRHQSVEETHAFVTRCREKGFESVNIDLIYGLPFQTAEGFEHTLESVCAIDPDRIALYNFAFLPSKLPHQRKIEESSLPDAEERLSILKCAIEGFTSSGFAYIGMDHFAKPNDELTLAQNEGTLQRNFMGFTTRAGSDLYAFGTSAISSLPLLYVQNIKKLNRYNDSVDEGRLPVERGIVLSKDDRIRRWVIMEMMCNLRVPTDRFKQVWDEDFHSYFVGELTRIQPFIDDGLLEPDLTPGLRVTERGQIIIRPIAMVFDAYLSKPKQSGKPSPVYSKTL